MTRHPLILLALASPAFASTAPPIEEIIVTAEFREGAALEVPASVAVLDAETVERGAVQHFEELAELVPNLNYSGEGNRAQYFQIRGIGERAQYEGAPNPSVGFIVDDIDFSGIGGIATLWDVEQIEVFRGPQGTRYGANALAGLVYVRTAAPPDRFESEAELTLGDHGTRGVGISIGGPLTRGGAVTGRLAAQRFESDGFRQNVFLGVDDSHGRDEATLRGKLAWQAGDDWTVDLAAFYVDTDNGYDAFTIDNDFTTESDRPGRDAQRSLAGSLRIAGELGDSMTLTSITGAARSDVTFSFDADWGNAGFWAPYVYDFFSATSRDRETLNQELRLLHAGEGPWSWVAGLYLLSVREANLTRDDGIYVDPAFPDFPFALDAGIQRAYDADSRAVFGELDYVPDERNQLTFGLRVERRDAGYRDTAGNAFDPSETMVGGHLTWSRTLESGAEAYARVARGYKAGGFNLGLPAEATDDERLFEAEFLWNYEVGLKGRWLDGRLIGDLALFWSERRDQQVETSVQLDPGNPTTFVFFTDNAGSGWNAGLEASAEWQASESLRLHGAVGWLETEIEAFGSNTALAGREQAHAPRLSYALGGTWEGPAGWFARLDVAGKSAFYFSDSHDQRSDAYALVNLRVGLERDRWALHLWARNLFDERYATRGFFFGNEPPDFPDTLYVKPGDPRQLGVTARFRF